MKKSIFTLLLIAAGGATATAQLTAVSDPTILYDTETNAIHFSSMDIAEAATYCDGGGYVYIYNVGAQSFISAGGTYGVQAVLTDYAMRFKVEKSASYSGHYVFQSRVKNSVQLPHLGAYLGTSDPSSDPKVYLDRSTTRITNLYNNGPIWEPTEVSGQATINAAAVSLRGYRLRNTYSSSPRRYLSHDNATGTKGAQVSTSITGTAAAAATWRFIKDTDFEQMIGGLAQAEVSVPWIKDATFTRDSQDATYWKWGGGNAANTDGHDTSSEPAHWHQRTQDTFINGVEVTGITDAAATIGSNVTTSTGGITADAYRAAYAKYYTAEIYNEQNSLTQELPISDGATYTMPVGTYRIQMQGFYHDGDAGTTNDGAAYLVVKRTSTSADPAVQAGENATYRILLKTMSSESGNDITVASGVSAGLYFAENPSAYTNAITFRIREEGTRLEFGIETTGATGWTVGANWRLWAYSESNYIVDENWSEAEAMPYQTHNATDDTWTARTTEAVDPYGEMGFDKAFPIASTVYYRRTLTPGAWNPICLPFALTAAQIQTVFGNETRVSRFNGLDADCITFVTQHIANDGMEAGVPYLICPEGTKNTVPAMSEGTSYYVPKGNNIRYVIENADNTDIYAIHGVEKTAAALPPAQTVTAGDLAFEGTYFRKPVGLSTAGQENYVITKGQMYHLTNTADKTVWGTYAYLHMPKETGAQVKTLSVVAPDGRADEVTAIDGIVIDGGADAANYGIFSLSGQKVGKGSLGDLPKGLYIMNGRKFLVK